jgi:hypothetical protein
MTTLPVVLPDWNVRSAAGSSSNQGLVHLSAQRKRFLWDKGNLGRV